MPNEYNIEQDRLITEVTDIRNKRLGAKRTGQEVCELVKEYISAHVPPIYKIAGPNAFIGNLPTEYDLLIVKVDAITQGVGFEPSDVRVVFEIKTAGIRATKEYYPNAIAKIRESFDEVRKLNQKVWGALLM